MVCFYASNYHPSESGYFTRRRHTIQVYKAFNDSAGELGREEALLLEKALQAYHMCLAIVGNVDILEDLRGQEVLD